MTTARFRKIVWDFYTEHGRSELPWRKTKDPYKILVSEMMLQQTQVERVIPYYRAFIKTYPNVRMLAKAPLADVLHIWQGLGYNRRAKFLHGTARYIVDVYGGKIPTDAAELESIWGIGPYTARAVMTFAYNHNAIFIETNIRTVIIHHFFKDRNTVSDVDITEILKKVLPRGEARAWYSALMDYGSYLKRSGVQHNTKIKGYAKQKPFAGSRREIRGAIIRALSQKTCTEKQLHALLPQRDLYEVQEVLKQLTKEGMVGKRGSRYMLPTA
jgi:A/G-specific adenine glycosylase